MNLSFLASDRLTYFYNFLKTIKSDRNKNEHKVIIDIPHVVLL